MRLADAASGDFSPGGLCWESGCARGSRKPCPVFPMAIGTRTLILQLVSHNSAWFSVLKVKFSNLLSTSAQWKISAASDRTGGKCTCVDKIIVYVWSQSGTSRMEAKKPSHEGDPGHLIQIHTSTAVYGFPMGKKAFECLNQEAGGTDTFHAPLSWTLGKTGWRQWYKKQDWGE